MKMTYTENPLATRVELDEAESRMLWHIIKAKELEELLFEVHCHLDPRHLDVNKARDDADLTYILGDDDNVPSGLEQRVNTLHAHCMAELQSYHVGDCTCVPCGCSKCYAEDLLGIDTVPGLGKHAGHTILRLFQDDGCTTCAQAIALLEQRDPTSPALAWLRAYQQTHLAQGDTHGLVSGTRGNALANV